MPEVACVYCIKNIITGRIYYGETTNLKNRIKGHKSYLSSNRCESVIFQYDYDVHGVLSFVVDIIDYSDSIMLRRKIETILIKFGGDTYNRINIGKKRNAKLKLKSELIKTK